MKQAALLLVLTSVIFACGPQTSPTSAVTQPAITPHTTPRSEAEAEAQAEAQFVPGTEPGLKPPAERTDEVVFPTEVVLATGRVWLAPAGRSPLGGRGESNPQTALRLGEVAIAEPTPLTPAIAWDQAHEYLGEHITVEGRVVHTHRSKSRVVFLNFDADWAGKFYVPVFRSAYATMPIAAETFFLNQTVRVTGEVALFKGTPNIAVSDLSQLQVVGDGPGLRD